MNHSRVASELVQVAFFTWLFSSGFCFWTIWLFISVDRIDLYAFEYKLGLLRRVLENTLCGIGYLYD